MKTSLKSLLILPLMAVLVLSSCKKDEDEPVAMKSKTYNYAFNTGQVGAGTEYDGTHAKNLTAMITLDELSGGKTKVTVSLMNTMNGEMYMVHSHDAADPMSTPNGTPYNESPNANVLVGMVSGNGGTASYSQESNMSFDALTTQYNGFFVVHDPLQQVSTTDLSTYLIVAAFAR
ncbi:MAG TPA: hypothetical protein DIW47_12225 [Bacteroidetes bacterium]|nr:hypothetical protein [Bacteroidota bacterium]